MPPRRPAPVPPTYFATPADFGAWLAAHGTTADELLVGFHKVDSGRPSMTWPQSVDEALCHGWIDGVRRRIDEHAYSIRFTPRRATSIWSAVNIARVAVLTAEGRMTAAGLAAFERRSAKKSAIYAYEQATTAALTAKELAAIRKAHTTRAYFDALPPGYLRQMTHWITSAKKPETRAKRLATFIEACAAQRRIGWTTDK